MRVRCPHAHEHTIGSTNHEDGRVVVDVEEGELLPLAAHDDEEGVEKVENLAEVEHVHDCGHGRLACLRARGD